MKTESGKPTYINGAAPAVRVTPIQNPVGMTKARTVRPQLLAASRRPTGAAPASPENPPAAVPETVKEEPSMLAPVTPKRRPKKPPITQPADQAGKRRPPKPAGLQKPVDEGHTKKSKVLALLRRPQGATLAELQQATGWQAHSVRGFLSGALTKKMGLKVKSAKRAEGTRVYSVRK